MLGATTPTAQLARGRSLAIALDFDGPQPVYFDAAPARAEPMTGGGFVGDTRAGGSCNASVVTVNPHCNGTHTECVGHITDTRITIDDCAPTGLLSAELVTVVPARAGDVGDALPAAAEAGDRVIPAAAIAAALARLAAPTPLDRALIIRTEPNEPDKRGRAYRRSGDYAYPTVDAVRATVAAGVAHLLIDTPSLDRLDDGGRLELHRVFWGIEKGGREITADTRRHATVTEMIYVADDIEDGAYLLSLQIAPFGTDAAPSRPVVYPAGSGTP